MAVLYRKYRPQIFAQVVGQKSIIQTLQNQIKQGLVSHAYLFTGSRGVGKTSVARILAKAVNCENREKGREKREKEGDACGECGVCKAIEQGNFIDLIEIDAASNTGVDNVRDLIEHVKFAPSLGKYKVFIIDEVHMLSKGAFNALLKTLEEPPKHAIFILATTEIQKVPATIISRTQRFDFKTLSLEDLKNHLRAICEKENLKYGDEIINLLAEHAAGGARDALSLLDKIATLGEGASLDDVRAVLGITDQAMLKQILSIIADGEANKLPIFFDGLLEKGTDFGVFNKDLLEYLRDLLIKKLTSQAHPLAEKLSINDVIFIIRLFLKSFKDLQTAPSPEIPLLLSAIEATMKKSSVKSSVPVPAQTQNKANQSDVAYKSYLTDEVADNHQLLKNDSAQSDMSQQFSRDNITHEEVLEFWPRVVSAIKEQNGPLGSLLKAAQLSGVKNGTLRLQVKFLFDKKTLEKNSAVVVETIKTVSGKNLGIVAETLAIESPGDPVAALSDALKVFGGELVE